jgi:hypothetical protein
MDVADAGKYLPGIACWALPGLGSTPGSAGDQNDA